MIDINDNVYGATMKINPATGHVPPRRPVAPRPGSERDQIRRMAEACGMRTTHTTETMDEFASTHSTKTVIAVFYRTGDTNRMERLSHAILSGRRIKTLVSDSMVQIGLWFENDDATEVEVEVVFETTHADGHGMRLERSTNKEGHESFHLRVIDQYGASLATTHLNTQEIWALQQALGERT